MVENRRVVSSVPVACTMIQPMPAVEPMNSPTTAPISASEMLVFIAAKTHAMVCGRLTIHNA